MNVTAGFGHVATLTSDLDRCVTFYSQVFGAALRASSPAQGDHPRMAVLDLGSGATLHVFEVPESSIVGDRSRQGGRGPIDHFAIAATSRESFDTLTDRLVASQASSGQVNMLGGHRSVFFRDPDGAELELTCSAVD